MSSPLGKGWSAGFYLSLLSNIAGKDRDHALRALLNGHGRSF